MFMSKVLISCALIVAAQAGYAPAANYGSKAVLGGYVAHIQPRATVSVPHYGSYGSYGGYGAAPAYGAVPAYGNTVNDNASYLTSLALSLPHAGAPIPTSIAHPQYPSTSYSAPAHLAPAYGAPAYGSPATGASAAAAGSKVVANSPRAAYAPVVSSYGPAAAPY